VSCLPRPKPPYEMMNVCIRAPVDLVRQLKQTGMDELSEFTVKHWRTLVNTPTDPLMATVQTKLCAAVGEKPSLKQEWIRDDVRCEAFIRAHYLLDEFDKAITSNHISVAMTNIIKGEA
jgi:hypothetical protein